MLKKNSFSKGYGLITDYIAAVLHALRNDDRTALLNDYVPSSTVRFPNATTLPSVKHSLV